MNSSLSDFKLKIDDAYVNKMPQFDNYGVIRFNDLSKMRKETQAQIDVTRTDPVEKTDNIEVMRLDPFPAETKVETSILHYPENEAFLKQLENIDIEKLNVSTKPQRKPLFRLFK